MSFSDYKIGDVDRLNTCTYSPFFVWCGWPTLRLYIWTETEKLKIFLNDFWCFWVTPWVLLLPWQTNPGMHTQTPFTQRWWTGQIPHSGSSSSWLKQRNERNHSQSLFSAYYLLIYLKLLCCKSSFSDGKIGDVKDCYPSWWWILLGNARFKVTEFLPGLLKYEERIMIKLILLCYFEKRIRAWIRRLLLHSDDELDKYHTQVASLIRHKTSFINGIFHWYLS